MDRMDDEPPSFWRSPVGWALVVVGAAGGFYLVTEHTEHSFGAQPYLFLLACPLMLFLMHSGHGRKGHGRGQPMSNDHVQRRR